MKTIEVLLGLLIIFTYINTKKKNTPENFNNLNKKIIIVGNAPYTEKLGKFIDSFNTVVRFNNYSLEKKHQKFIGSKTDIWCMSCFVYHSNKKLYHNRKNKVKKILVLKPEIFLDKYHFDNNKNTELLIQNQDIKIPNKYNFGKNWPSTGLLSIFYFIKKYNEVYVTGFNHFDTSKGSIHYYENLKQLGHKSDLEKRIFNDLKLKKNIILI